jgi:hypothetical protein
MAHPLRLALLELLDRHGTLTSTQASAATGESTASCSFHLRQLAKYGFIESAEAADGRERPWRRAAAGERVPDSADRELNQAAAEVTRMVIERVAGDAATWVDRRNDLPRAWRGPGVVDAEVLHLTSAEVAEVARAVTAVFARYAHRNADRSKRPRGSRAVRAAAAVFPLLADESAMPSK